MTVTNPPVFMDGTTLPAEIARRYTSALMGPGLARRGDLAVAQSLTPAMTVAVAAGGVFVAGSSATFQGMYFVESRGTETKTIAAPHATNPRWDLIVARVKDNPYDASGVLAWDIEVVTGTPNASPVDPATPANSVVLARVVVRSVAAGGGTVVTGDITNLATIARPWNSSWGIVADASSTAPSVNVGGTQTCLTVTLNTVAGRRYEIEGMAYEAAQGGAGLSSFEIWNPSAAIALDFILRAAGNTLGGPRITAYETPGAVAAYTYRLRLATTGANAFVAAASNSPMRLVVKDVGPA